MVQQDEGIFSICYLKDDFVKMKKINIDQTIDRLSYKVLNCVSVLGNSKFQKAKDRRAMETFACDRPQKVKGLT